MTVTELSGVTVPDYLIAFNDEWVPELSDEEFREAGTRVRALRAEMREAGVLIYTGGVDETAPVFSVDASGGSPVFSDGPFAPHPQPLGGFALITVADEAAARLWAGRIAVACGWPQEVRRFHTPPSA